MKQSLGSVIGNPVQFAVVREDPRWETNVVHETDAKRALLIGSGGCTAFHLKSIKPDLHVTVMDPNPHQLQLIQAKERLLLSAQWSISDFLPLTQCGNFESLFAMWRQFVHEFVMSDQDFRDIVFHDASPLPFFDNPYWPTSFALFFSDPLLLTMFGPNAIQHAPSGSYIPYFQSVMERALTRGDRATNYFLHHIVWGTYIMPHCPYYLTHGITKSIDSFVQGVAQDITDFSSYDLISLSNIFDWMPLADSYQVLACLQQTMKPDSTVLIRQLNNDHDYDLGPLFSKRPINMDQDQSLFYQKTTQYTKEMAA